MHRTINTTDSPVGAGRSSAGIRSVNRRYPTPVRPVRYRLSNSGRSGNGRALW